MNGSFSNYEPEPSRSTVLSPLEIIIVGAGIGGLSAAIFLRQRGHKITILEQSQLANEIGAAVHLAPNANGLLRRIGIWAEETGANPALRMTQFLPNGKPMFSVDLDKGAAMWQHPWLLAHRAHLHSELKRKATTAEGKGIPAVLRTGCRVIDVDCQGGVTIATGENLQGDLIIGADGVHSRTRTKLPGAENMKPHGSGKSAYRFLIPKERVLEYPEIAKYASEDGHLQMFMGRDRRVVIYPTSSNSLLNFVCIHPTAESQTLESVPGEWNHHGDLERLLHIYRDFEPALLKLLGLAGDEGLKVWELLDMEGLPTWCEGRLCCIGDAAHPFTPHQGQGAGQAIEDAASLAAVLPLGTSLEEVPGRLKLYEKCRYERASRIQEYSRLAGKDLSHGPQFDANQYTGYNFGHDEWDFSIQKFHEYMRARKPNTFWRNPIGFGPMPGPRQDFLGSPHENSGSTFRTATVKFKTSRTLLQNLLPSSAFRFSSPSSVAYASFSFTTLENLDWLGGRGYNHFGLYIHGIEFVKSNGEVIKGTYLPILFENLADPIVSGREELGMPKVWCELNFENSDDNRAWKMNAQWMGERFCEMQISGLKSVSAALSTNAGQDQADDTLLWYKYIPKSGAVDSETLRQADASYAVCISHSEEAKTTQRTVDASESGKGDFKFSALGVKRLPTLHHIVERLSEIPVYDMIEATLVEGRGASDVRAAQRLI